MGEQVARWLIGPTLVVVEVGAGVSSVLPWQGRALFAIVVVTVVAGFWTLLPAGPWPNPRSSYRSSRSGRRDRRPRRRPSAVPVRKGWWTHAVRATTSTGETLDRMGVAGHDVRSGTRLVLAWSSTEVELWTGDAVLTTFRWDHTQVGHVPGDAGWRRAECVGLLVRGKPLVLMPDRRPEGAGCRPRGGGLRRSCCS